MFDKKCRNSENFPNVNFGTKIKKTYHNRILFCINQDILLHELIRNHMKNIMHEVGGAQSGLGFGTSESSTFIERLVINTSSLALVSPCKLITQVSQGRAQPGHV